MEKDRNPFKLEKSVKDIMTENVKKGQEDGKKLLAKLVPHMPAKKN